MKHAYLIIAHNEFSVLSHLIGALDDVRNDIFIHFDAKVNNIPNLVVDRARLFLTSERVDVRWGDVSVVEAEYALFAEAAREGAYAYYHLLSGVDMPLKSQDEIHQFFGAHQGKEFIGFSHYDYAVEVERKVQKYHLFPRDFKFSRGMMGLFKKALRFLFLRAQYMVGYSRYPGVEFKKGTQWVSVTQEFVVHLLAHREEVLKTYHHTFCSDEIYKQTLCWDSVFQSRLYDPQDEGRGSLRKIGWSDGELRDWADKDYGILVGSDALFARKFNSRDLGLVEKIGKHVS